MIRQGASLVAALTLAALPAAASSKDTGMATVRGLADFCSAKLDTEKNSACAAFVSGVMAIEAAEHSHIDPRMAFCPPGIQAESIGSQDELIAGTVKMFVALQNMAHSEEKLQNAPALAGVIAAGQIAFPCPGDTG